MVAKIGFVRNADRLVLAATTALLLLSGTAVVQLALTGNIPIEGISVPVSQKNSNFEQVGKLEHLHIQSDQGMAPE